MVPDKLITADCHITPPLSIVNELPEHYREYFPRIEKNENGKDSVWRKNCDIIAKSMLRTMKFARYARMVDMSCENRFDTIRPRINRFSKPMF